MPVRAHELRYSAVAILPSGGSVPLDDSVAGWQLEEQPGEYAQRATLTVKDDESAAGFMREVIGLGSKIVLLADQGSGFFVQMLGTVLTADFDDSGMPQLPITVYDDLYFTTGEDMRYVKAGTSAKSALQTIFADYGVVANVTGPLTSISAPLTLEGQIKDAIEAILAEAYWSEVGAEGTLYMVQARYTEAGTIIDVIEPGMNTNVYRFNNSNVFSVRDAQDMTGLVTEVHVVSEASEGTAMLEDDPPGPGETSAVTVRPMLDQLVMHPNPAWGAYRLRKFVKKSASDTPEKALNAAQLLLSQYGAPKRVRTLSTLDVPELRRGHIVHCQVGTLDGLYIASGVQHDPTTRTMTLTIDSTGLKPFRQAKAAKEKKTVLADEPEDEITKNLPRPPGDAPATEVVPPAMPAGGGPF